MCSEIFADKPGQVAAGRWLVAQLGRDKVVLDVGCGSGLPTARQLAEAGCTVIGVDTSPVMLDLARKYVPNAIFVERDLHDLSGLHPRQGRFDGATAFFSWQMLSREDLGKALDAIRGVLAPDGVFVIGMAEDDSEFETSGFLGVTVPVTVYRPDELRELLAHHGFGVLEMLSGAQHYAYCRVTPTM